MISHNITIKNASGLHARPAVNFVSNAKQFQSDIRVGVGDRTLNGKSIVSVLSAGITANSEITLNIDGADEQAALAALIEAIESGLGE